MTAVFTQCAVSACRTGVAQGAGPDCRWHHDFGSVLTIPIESSVVHLIAAGRLTVI